jgi:hypothetical protein
MYRDVARSTRADVQDRSGVNTAIAARQGYPTVYTLPFQHRHERFMPMLAIPKSISKNIVQPALAWEDKADNELLSVEDACQRREF